MTTATAPAPIAPLEEWDNESAQHATQARLAGSIAWQILSHSQGSGPDITRMVGPQGQRRALPDDVAWDSEDMFGFLWDLITDAGEIGYVLGCIDRQGFELPWENGKLRTADLARAVAALLRIDVINDGETFDPEYDARQEAQPA